MNQSISTTASAPAKNAAGSLRVLAGVAVVALLALWPLIYLDRFVLTVVSLVLMSSIGATSLNLIIRTGHVSLAHAAFMGVAAYACVLAELRLGLPFPVALVLGCAASGGLAMLLGPVVLRLTGKYFVLITFLIGEIIRMIFVEWISLTGGSNGIQGLPKVPLIDSPLKFYYLVLFLAVLCIGICWRILGSEIGRAIDSAREGERIAECSGVPVIRLKVLVFVVACALVGVQGALQAHFLNFIDPTSFSMDVSLFLVVMNVIGGMYQAVGPLIGTVFMVAMPELLRGYVELQRVIFGVILIVVMAVLPGGIAGSIGVIRRLFGRASRRAAS